MGLVTLSFDRLTLKPWLRARCQRGCTCCVELRLKSTLNGFERSQSLDFLYLLLLVLSAYRITVSLPVFIT